jgi:hypothetical protein
MAATTAMMIRVQANGGKFLADDIGGREVTVRDARTGRWLGGGRVQGPDSGTLQSGYVPSAPQPVSFLVNVTMMCGCPIGPAWPGSPKTSR